MFDERAPYQYRYQKKIIGGFDIHLSNTTLCLVVYCVNGLRIERASVGIAFSIIAASNCE